MECMENVETQKNNTVFKDFMALNVHRNANRKSSSNSGYLDWKPDKIRVFQSFLYLCDVNMMLKIEPAIFPTPKWMRLKSLSKCGNISLGLPGW